ncbi:hypothetical protein VP01_3961g1, partial [Puccinia sorghi]
KWHSYLLSLSEPFEFLTDHNALKYFMSSEQWFQKLYHIKKTFTPERGRPLPIITLIIDPCCRDIQSNITLYLKDYSISKNYLPFYKEKIVAPDNPSLKLSILESRHYSPLADVRDYFNSCYDCNRNKSSNHWKYGLLQPLPILPLPWNSLSMAFISQLPLLNGYDAILVVIDCFSKIMVFLIKLLVIMVHCLCPLFGLLCSPMERLKESTKYLNNIFEFLSAISRMIGASGSLWQNFFQTLYGINPIFDPNHVSFKSNFELTLKQPVNAKNNKLINFASNLPLSTSKAWSIQNQISCFKECFQTFDSFEMEGNPPSFSCFPPRASQGSIPRQNSSSSRTRQRSRSPGENYNTSSNGLVISPTKIELPGNPPTIFETLLTWFKTFIQPILTNLVNLKSFSSILKHSLNSYLIFKLCCFTRFPLFLSFVILNSLYFDFFSLT